jgi:hypothetical protein
MVIPIPKEEQKRMSYEAIEKSYDGKWVFLIDIIDDPFSGIPVIIADEPMEDAEEGIYKQFTSSALANGTLTGCVSLLKLTPSISGFITL